MVNIIKKSGASVEEIFKNVRGYWKTSVIIASIDFDLFTHLQFPKTVDTICKIVKTDLTATERLLDALVHLNLLQKQDDKYFDTQLSLKYLNSKSPHYIGHIILYHKSRYNVWGEISKSIRTGKPVAQASFLVPDQEQINNYALAMSARAKLDVENVLENINLESCLHLLDLGGAPGTFAVAMAKKYPTLNITVFDLPDMLEITKEVIKNESHIKVVAGNFSSDKIGHNYCAIFMSQILDSLGIENVRMIFKNVFNALKPGGQIIIRDFILSKSHTQPEVAIYRNLNVFLTTQSGRVLNIEEFNTLLNKVGFKELHFLELSGNSDLILGLKPL